MYELAKEIMPADPEKAQAWLEQTFQPGYLQNIGNDDLIRRAIDQLYRADILEKEYIQQHKLHQTRKR